MYGVDIHPAQVDRIVTRLNRLQRLFHRGFGKCRYQYRRLSEWSINLSR